MFNVLASITDTNINETIEGAGNILSYGGQMMLIGICTVFTVLTIIWICIVGLKYAFGGGKAKSSAEPTQSVQPQPQAITATPADAEIIAVIAAAIAAAESENNGLKFRVVSFKRK